MTSQDRPTPARRIVFWTFFVLFLLTTLAVLLYGSGYTIHVPSRSIIATGSLLIKVKPNDALVTIAGKTYQNEIPLRVVHEIPRTVAVTIEKDGYFPWRKELAIEPKQTTFVDTVLIKNDSPTIKETFTRDARIALSPDGTLLLIQTPRANELIVREAATTHHIPLPAIPKISTAMSGVPLALSSAEWNADGSRALLIFTSSDGIRRSSIFSLARPFELAPPLEEIGLSPMRWDTEEPWLLQVRNARGQKFVLHTITQETRAFIPDSAQKNPNENVRASTNKTKTLWYTQREVLQKEDDGTQTLLLRTSDRIQRVLPVPDAPYAAVLTDTKLFLVAYDARGQRMMYPLLPEKKITDIGITKNGLKLLAIVREKDAMTYVEILIR